MQMAAKMSYNPAKVLGIPKGTLDEGKIADITIIDPNKEYTIDVNTFESRVRIHLLTVTKFQEKLNIQFLTEKLFTQTNKY